jgi:hypothetical protein
MGETAHRRIDGRGHATSHTAQVRRVVNFSCMANLEGSKIFALPPISYRRCALSPVRRFAVSPIRPSRRERVLLTKPGPAFKG